MELGTIKTPANRLFLQASLSFPSKLWNLSLVARIVLSMPWNWVKQSPFRQRRFRCSNFSRLTCLPSIALVFFFGGGRSSFSESVSTRTSVAAIAWCRWVNEICWTWTAAFACFEQCENTWNKDWKLCLLQSFCAFTLAWERWTGRPNYLSHMSLKHWWYTHGIHWSHPRNHHTKGHPARSLALWRQLDDAALWSLPALEQQKGASSQSGSL